MRTDLYAASPARLIAALGGVLIATFIAAGLFGSVAPATAQDGFGNIFGYQAQQRYKRRAVPRRRAPSSDARATAETADKGEKKTGKKEEAKKSAPKGAVYAVISLADQHVTVYDATGRIAQSRVSTGMPGHPTPIGLFSIIGKERWHHSNVYSGAPMPYMQRITWSGVAMHLGVVPGYPASHGCIRLPAAFAPQLWGMTQIGNRVVIARRDTTPFEIESASLPAPKMRPAPDVLPGSQQSSLPPSASVQVASISETSPVAVSAATAPQETRGPGATVPKLLNPLEYAKALRERALASKAAADQAAKDALAAAQAAGTEARQAVDDINRAEADLKAAEAKLAALDAAPSAAVATAPGPVTPPATTQAVSTQPAAAAPATTPAPDAAAEAAAAAAAAANARAAVQAEIDRARAALAEAQSRDAVKRPVAFAAVQAWKDAVAAGELAAQTVKEADRRLEPVSVLFSKREGRVFIRQDWKEVYEAPITFKDPDRPVGTHLFIAVDGDGDGKVKWSAISVPSGATPSDDPPRRRSKNDKDKKDVPAAAPQPQGDAAATALERVEVADSVRERIADLLWIGAQVIVTDNARSDEMDVDSDIIVSTR